MTLHRPYKIAYIVAIVGRDDLGTPLSRLPAYGASGMPHATNKYDGANGTINRHFASKKINLPLTDRGEVSRGTTLIRLAAS